MATSRHYPLNGLDLSFDRYHHRRLDVIDVLASHLMEAWLFPIRDPVTPGKALPAAFGRPLRLHYGFIWASEGRPGGFTHPHPRANPPPPETNDGNHADFLRDLALLILSQTTHGGGFPCPGGRETPGLRSADAQLIAVLRRYAFETSHPELDPWLAWQPRGYQPAGHGGPLVIGCCPKHHYALDTARPRNCARGLFFARSTRRIWSGADIHRLRWHHRRPLPLQDERILSQGTILQDARRGLGAPLWTPGPSGLPPPVPDVIGYGHTPGDPYKAAGALLPSEPGSWAWRSRLMTRPYYSYSTTLRTRRARSEPPPGAYMLTSVSDTYSRPARGKGRESEFYGQPRPEDYLRRRRARRFVVVPLFVPCPRVSEVDHRTRRRSLSRRHVARMFHVPSRQGGCLVGEEERERVGGVLRRLGRRCGWCGSQQHRDDKCPVSKRNRCKCRPWPIYHTARECPVECSRFCVDAETRRRKGHGWPAMMCKARCCMCGVRGHCGRDCERRRCRCGGVHLGQDCGWKPGCVAEGCDRFLCPAHCQECGSGEKPFVGRRCKQCLGNGAPVGVGACERGESKRARYRRRRRERCDGGTAKGGLKVGDETTGRDDTEERDSKV